MDETTADSRRAPARTVGSARPYPPGPCEYCGAHAGEECIPYCIGAETEEA